MRNVMTAPRLLLALTAAMLFAAGCASTPAQDESRGERFCLKVREIKSYTALDTRHVLVKARVSDYYLFTLDYSCDGLAFAQGMAVEGRVNQVCDDGFGSLTYRDSSRGVRRCTILAIDPVKDADAAKALIAERAEN
jgi:hypothetical protein